MDTQEHLRYEQELSRSLRVLGNIAITVSAVTPASSVFIIVPLILLTAGTGSFLALVFAAVIGVFMSYCWAELSAAYPISGGDYALVWHAFKGRSRPLSGPMSFVTLALVLAQAAFIPAVIALGTASYLSVVAKFDTKTAGAIVMIVSAGVAILNIRLNAFVTGVFLTIELLALLVLTVLGIAHVHGRLDLLFSHWVIGNARGGLDAVKFGTILTATSIAVFAYNGYANAVNFSEETRGSSRGVATAILWSLVITVAAELIPTTTVLLGAPSVARVTTDAAPMNYFLLATSVHAMNTLVSLGIAIAIINATIAIILEFGRILFSSGRDRAWPGPLNASISLVSKRFQTPWLATALIGVVGAILCLTVSLNTLIVLTGASLVANYAVVALAAIFGRATRATGHSPYKMPWWPLPPILAIAALAYITTKQTGQALRVTGITILIGLIYWAVVIWPQRGRAWNLKMPVLDEVAS